MPDKEIFVLKIVWRKSIASLHRLTQAVQRANLWRTAGDPTWVLQKKAFILSCFGLEEQRRGIDMGLPRPSCLKKYFYPRRPYTFCGEQALRPLDTATPLTIWLHKAEYQSFHLIYHLFLY